MSDNRQDTRRDPYRDLRRTTTFFRVFNFELFAKPSKKVMVFGTAAITGCVVFLVFLNFTHDKTRRKTSSTESSSTRPITRWER